MPTFSPQLRNLKALLRDFFPVQKFTVSRQSMLPTLRPGDQVLVWRWVRPGPGDIVVARVGHNHFIKRVRRVAEGKYFLLGDNPRAPGATTPTVYRSDIVGRVFFVQKWDEPE